MFLFVDNINVYEHFLSPKGCKKYISMLPEKKEGFLATKLLITDDPIVNGVKNFIKQRKELDLKIDTAEICNWHKGSESELHIHDDRGRVNTKYNSIIYLNKSFTGGEFYTSDNQMIEPEVGMLIHFDGSKIWHGIKKILDNDRYSIIFFWKK